CHCEVLCYIYRTALAPSEWSVRGCRCGFCRAHGVLSTSDPDGSLEIQERGAGLVRYRFAQRTTDFLLCARCGVYIGAAIATDNGQFGIINLRTLYEPPGEFTPTRVIDYSAESGVDRVMRRERTWTPIKHFARIV